MNKETVKECPVCKGTNHQDFLICKDYLVSQDHFTIQACESCGFRFTNPRPAENEMGNYYQSVAYVSHNDQSGGIINRIYRIVRQFTLTQKLSLINKIRPAKGKLLDVGCGTGLFLETCQQGGWQVWGVEPDNKAQLVAANRLNKPIAASVKKLSSEQYDIITMWHVLEHVPNLDQTLEEIKTKLVPNGVLLLALPNSNSLDAQYFGQHWAAYDVPRHLSHFTPATIDQLIAKLSFTLIDKKPMYFDAFYIAMLSTRYRDGKTNWLESAYQGLRSNFKASKSGDYSSLIYIFQKEG